MITAMKRLRDPRALLPPLVFTPFLIILGGMAFAYMPVGAALISALVLLGSAGALFFVSARAASYDKKAETKENELVRALSFLEDALVVYDSSFVLRYANKAAEQLFHISGEKYAGKAFSPKDAEHEELRPFVQVLFPSLAPKIIPRSSPDAQAQISDISFENPRKEYRVLTAPLDERYFMKVIRDRTREVELLESKTDFVTVASHQLRTPVNEIVWALESLKGDTAIPEEKRAVIDHATESGKRLLGLVENLLSAAQIEEGKYGYQFEQTDLVEFVGTVAGAALPSAERAGIALYFDRPEGQLPQVSIDTAKLGIVLTNLIDNAIRYNTEHGQVTIRVAPVANEPFLEVQVKDTGIGIPSEEVPKLFGKFFRASNAVKFATEGSGMGLAIAKNIVEAHGGQMSAESEMNRGSTFSFTIPTDPSLIPQQSGLL
jgi:signal transduction histidine kinase